MENKNLPDFTHVIKKIFTLTDNIHKLRGAFLFSNTDGRAKMDRKFIKRWREIEAKSVE